LSEQSKKCACCGQTKPVYAYSERDFEDVEDYVLKEDLLIEGSNRPLADNDVVGLPICRECFNAGACAN